jgi:hypothetical protein
MYNTVFATTTTTTSTCTLRGTKLYTHFEKVKFDDDGDLFKYRDEMRF